MNAILFELKEGLLISLSAIRANKIRAVLTTLGIVIGISSVVLMSTALKGIDTTFQEGVSIMGSSNLYISKRAWFDRDSKWWEVRNRKNIQYETYEQYKKIAQLPISVSPMINSRQQVKFKDKTIDDAQIQGTNADYIYTTNLVLGDGRFFNDLEDKSARDVVVVGKDIAEKLFVNVNGENELIEIGGKKYRVVGLLDKQGSSMMGGGFNPDTQLLVPIQSMYKYFVNKNEASLTINVRASEEIGAVDKTKDEAISIMRKLRGLKYYQEDDFAINQQEGLMEQIESFTGVLKIAGYFITGLALFVGAIGIMNIMFVSVKERTREIGVRKAIGAKRRAILAQFIFESSIICLIGGLIGLGIAVLLSMVVNQFIPTEIQIDTVIIAIVISILTGAISGVAPAYTAAKLDPVEALRYE